MTGYIKRIKYIKTNELYGYWEITLIDENGKLIGTLGNKNQNDPYNFRRETFGILASTNCYDLLRLGSPKPNPINITMIANEKDDKIIKIINKSGLTFEKLNTGLCITKRKIIENILNKNPKYPATIESITSRSLTFTLLLMGKHFGTFIEAGNIYYGFGYPLTSNEVSTDYLLKSCLIYSSFIKSILKFYKTDDLMKLSNTENIVCPKVEIIKNENDEIIGIQNEQTNMAIIDTQEMYEITDDKEKIKKLTLK